MAEAISKSLAKKAVAMKVDGVLRDLSDRVPDGASVAIVTRDDPAALELIRHDCAHVLAEAVQELFPGTQVTIGPVIENGFYYDFFRNEPFSTEDFAAIEAKMREIIASATRPSPRKCGSATARATSFAKKGEMFKVELVDAIPEDQDLKIYFQGDWFDLCRGPHMPSTGQVGDAFKLTKLAGAYWRGDSRTASSCSASTAPPGANRQELDAYLRMIEEAEKRDHRKHRPRDGAVPSAGGGARPGVLAPEGLGDLALRWKPTCAAASTRPATRRCSTPQLARPQALGGLGTLGKVPRKSCSWPRSRRKAEPTSRSRR